MQGHRAGNVYVTDDRNNRVLKLAGSNTQVELPFTLRVLTGVAVDTAGNIYVTDGGNGQVLELPAGSTTQVELPFSLKGIPGGVAVDTEGNVYVAGWDSVWKLSAGSNTPTRLPFAGLKSPTGVAVDTAGEISKPTFKGTWPVIPDSGVLACELGAVTFTPTGSNDTYAVNAIATNWAREKGWRRDFEHIWLTADGGQNANPLPDRP